MLTFSCDISPKPVSGQLLLPTIRESRVRASPRSRRILFRFGLDLRRRRIRRAILQAGLL